MEAIDLANRQLEAYAEFSRYANGLTVTDRQLMLMPPPPPWLPSTRTSGGTRKRAILSHGRGSSRAAGADDVANPTGGSNKRGRLCSVQWYVVPIPACVVANGGHSGDRAAYEKFGTHWQALDPYVALFKVDGQGRWPRTRWSMRVVCLLTSLTD